MIGDRFASWRNDFRFGFLVKTNFKVRLNDSYNKKFVFLWFCFLHFEREWELSADLLLGWMAGLVLNFSLSIHFRLLGFGSLTFTIAVQTCRDAESKWQCSKSSDRMIQGLSSGLDWTHYRIVCQMMWVGHEKLYL